MESEFIALDKAREEDECLQNFLEDVPNWSKPVPAICIHCDRQSTIGRAHNHMYNGKSRHILRRHNTIRQLLSNGIIPIDYVKSKDNISDPLTKGLNREQVERSSRGMGLNTTPKTPIWHTLILKIWHGLTTIWHTLKQCQNLALLLSVPNLGTLD